VGQITDAMQLNDKLIVAIHKYQSGNYVESEQIANEILEIDPSNSRALNLLGLSLHERGLSDEGIVLIRKAIEVTPDYHAAHNNLGTVYREIKRFELALLSIDRAIALIPASSDYNLNKASVLFEMEDYEKSLDSFEKTISLDPVLVEAYIGRGLVLYKLHRFAEALSSYDKAIELKPISAKAWEGRSRTFFATDRYDEALVALDKAMELEPSLDGAFLYRGDILFFLRRYDEALATYSRSLRTKPDLLGAWVGVGDVFGILRQTDDALAAYDRALTLKPDLAEAWLGRGNVLRERRRYDEAEQSYGRLLELNPSYNFAKSFVLQQKLLCCNWQNLGFEIESINKDVRERKKSAEPFLYQAISNSAEDLKLCAEIYCAERFPRSPIQIWSGESYKNTKIRIGYLSGEFRNQAVSILMTELLELHNRNRFELYAFDNSLDDGSEIRKRIMRAFDFTIDITRLGNLQAATAINQNKIDILVNLNGYFGRERTAVFSHRPAPVQINYLGFSGTMGADYIDYILADTYIIPPEQQTFYTEKVVYLPDTFQVSDSKRTIADRTPTRSELMLPDTGFVFCCFNNSFKITPTIFDIWMRLLKKIEGSVLWLSEDSATASHNLSLEAARRGIAPERLVFSGKAVEYSDYLARYRIADLFLDTFPFNAGTIANDVLWAGTPLITCSGETYPARMAGSLLNAIGAPELITQSLDDYEALALKLARDPSYLSPIKAKLTLNRDAHPLFDTARRVRHIESVYTTMWERSQRGEPPMSFSVEAV
jgi:protein O-GlcNAc transferase